MDDMPVVFISYSQKYTKIKELFVNLLQDFGFKCQVFDYGAIHSPVEVERELIGNSDCFIGLLTQDQKTEDGKYLCSHTVNAEIGMAYAANKPIQLFAFDEVDFSSIPFLQINTITKINIYTETSSGEIVFDTINMRQIIRTLLDFKKHIDTIYEKRRKCVDVFISYRAFRIEQELISDHELRIHISVDAIALKNLATHTHAARLLCERNIGKGIQLDDNEWQFKLFSPATCKPSIRIGENDYSYFRFYIDFTPPIVTGSELKYAYRRKHFNYFPYTMEELNELILSDKLINKIMVTYKMIGQDFFVTQPTDFLSFSMTFPANYPITEYKALVCYAKSEQIHDAESLRANDLLQLDFNEFDNIYTLRMDVSNPHQNLSYYLLYTPPSINVLEGD